MKKAAVVIGIDKTGNLTPLTSAAAGAERVGQWLSAEGFTVQCLTDKNGPLTRTVIEETIEEFVTSPPRYHLLLVYFSGHGYWQARSDTWLLSGAPVKTGEAINLEAAMDLAKYSGISNIIFVSDACRSIPDSRSGVLVNGGGVFPNYAEITTASKIDYFKATSEARAAYEGAISGVSQSVLTAALMAAYAEPEPDMVRQIVDGTETIEVVPNRRLEAYLQRKVDALLKVIDPNIQQQIEVNVPSSEDVYISRVLRSSTEVTTPPALPESVPASTPDAGHEAALAIARTLSTRSFSHGGMESVLENLAPDIDSKVRKRLPDANIDHMESKMGFVIHGAIVERAVVSQNRPNLTATRLDQGDGAEKPGLVRIESTTTFEVDRQNVASIGLQMQDGRTVVLAGLPGYIGHVRFGRTGLSNVSYVPSSNDERFEMYLERSTEIDELRAMVALAVDRHTFRVHSEREAIELADRIRILKRVDPTLGLYAALAFSMAGNDEQILSILSFMRNDLNADLFDVRLLANRHAPARDSSVPVIPFCPMLTQSWNLLQSRRVELPAKLRNAAASLSGSLWTTFEHESATEIFEAIETGELQ